MTVASCWPTVALDVPFLAAEREARIAKLRALMGRSDVTVAEKSRRVFEAYQVENDYGRTIEAYAGTVPRGEEEVPVDFLRVGRLGLLYLTRDGTEVGAWDHANRQWVELDSSYKNAISEGLRVAKKQSAPQLIRVPLPRPEPAQGGQG